MPNLPIMPLPNTATVGAGRTALDAKAQRLGLPSAPANEVGGPAHMSDREVSHWANKTAARPGIGVTRSDMITTPDRSGVTSIHDR